MTDVLGTPSAAGAQIRAIGDGRFAEFVPIFDDKPGGTGNQIGFRLGKTFNFGQLKDVDPNLLSENVRAQLEQQQKQFEVTGAREEVAAARTYGLDLAQLGQQAVQLEQQVRQFNEKHAIDLQSLELQRDNLALAQARGNRQDAIALTGLVTDRQNALNQNALAIASMRQQAQNLNANLAAQAQGQQANREFQAAQASADRTLQLVSMTDQNLSRNIDQQIEIARQLADFTRDPGDIVANIAAIEQFGSISSALASGFTGLTDEAIGRGAQIQETQDAAVAEGERLGERRGALTDALDRALSPTLGVSAQAPVQVAMPQTPELQQPDTAGLFNQFLGAMGGAAGAAGPAPGQPGYVNPLTQGLNLDDPIDRQVLAAAEAGLTADEVQPYLDAVADIASGTGPRSAESQAVAAKVGIWSPPKGSAAATPAVEPGSGLYPGWSIRPDESWEWTGYREAPDWATGEAGMGDVGTAEAAALKQADAGGVFDESVEVHDDEMVTPLPGGGFVVTPLAQNSERPEQQAQDGGIFTAQDAFLAARDRGDPWMPTLTVEAPPLTPEQQASQRRKPALRGTPNIGGGGQQPAADRTRTMLSDAFREALGKVLTAAPSLRTTGGVIAPVGVAAPGTNPELIEAAAGIAAAGRGVRRNVFGREVAAARPQALQQGIVSRTG
jgi:hypothetical protein